MILLLLSSLGTPDSTNSISEVPEAVYTSGRSDAIPHKR